MFFTSLCVKFLALYLCSDEQALTLIRLHCMKVVFLRDS